MSKDLYQEIAEGNPEALLLMARSIAAMPNLSELPSPVGRHVGDLVKVNGWLWVFSDGQWFKYRETSI